MSTPLNMHAARMALNRDPRLREWVELWLKSKERTVAATMTDEELGISVEGIQRAENVVVKKQPESAAEALR